jgi:hypothetical protein
MKTITVSIVQDDDVYISHRLDYDIASEGSTKQEAIDNIKEAASLFLEVVSPKEIQSRLKRRGQIEHLTI